MSTSTSDPLMADLTHHLQLCRELLAIVERENQVLRHPEGTLGTEYQAKKDLLPFLDQSLNRLQRHRVERRRRGASERGPDPTTAPLLREVQDLIMKIIVLDRENEQALLRKGLVPARHLPSAHRQRPHDVADLYRRRHEAAPAFGQEPPG